MDIMRTDKICRDFISGNQTIKALSDVSITIHQGKLTILRGRSGSGKTTLLNIMSGLDEPTSGSVWLDDENLSQMSREKKDIIRSKSMGFVFQSVALMPQMNAYENIEFMMRIAGQKTDKQRVEESLDRVGLLTRAKHFPAEMSGGEQQRIAIARAIVHRPKIVFADEPTAELDTTIGLTVMKIFKEQVEQGETVVMTTHDTNIMGLADYIYTLDDGLVIEMTTGGTQE